jgi:hypothetical protein
MTSDPPDAPPTMAAQDGEAFAQTVAFADPYVLADRDRDAIAGALARGRQRVADLQASRTPETVDAIAREAPLSEWRAQGLKWALAEDAEAVPGLFSRAELLRLGTGDGTAPPLDGWGMSVYPVSGLLGVRFPDGRAWDEFAARLSVGLLATRIPDLTLKVTEWLAEKKLPAALLPALLALATQDLLDEARPSDGRDWFAIVRAPDRMTRERFEDYVSALTTEGPLVPAAESKTRH